MVEAGLSNPKAQKPPQLAIKDERLADGAVFPNQSHLANANTGNLQGNTRDSGPENSGRFPDFPPKKCHFRQLGLNSEQGI